jgi:hypothetical protein
MLRHEVIVFFLIYQFLDFALCTIFNDKLPGRNVLCSINQLLSLQTMVILCDTKHRSKRATNHSHANSTYPSPLYFKRVGNTRAQYNYSSPLNKVANAKPSIPLLHGRLSGRHNSPNMHCDHLPAYLLSQTSFSLSTKDLAVHQAFAVTHSCCFPT